MSEPGKEMWYKLLQSAGAESLGLLFQYTCAKRKIPITRVTDKDRRGVSLVAAKDLGRWGWGGIWHRRWGWL